MNIKKVILPLVLLVLASTAVYYYYNDPLNSISIPGALQDGDIIFQSSTGRQSKAIELLTKSKYSHCGIIYSKRGKLYVFEAVQPVKLTPFSEWIERGRGGHYVVKRLKNADSVLTPDNLEKMKKAGAPFTGKNYDLTFEWSDEKIYCSELVWKIYKRALNIEVGETEVLGDFDLSHPEVQQIVRERYGDNIPTNETVISPEAIFVSPLLKTVVDQ